MKVLVSQRFFLSLTVLVAVSFGGLGASGCAELNARRDITEGNKHYTAGRYAQAVEKFQSAIEAAPQLEIAHHNCALTYTKLFDLAELGPERDAAAKQAITHFLGYLELVPQDEKIVSVLIKLYRDSGDYDGALAYWKLQLEKNPKSMVALGELGSISELALRFDEALAWYQKRFDVTSTDEGRVNALYSIGMVHYRVALNDMEAFGEKRLDMADRAIEAFQRALVLAPRNEGFYGRLDALYRIRSVGTEVLWGSAVERTSALVHRIKQGEIFLQKQREAAEQSAPDTEAGAPASAEVTKG